MNPEHHTVYFTLNISAERFLAYYQGKAQTVTAQCDDGRVVRFPANLLRGVLTRHGIIGRFALTFNKNNKVQAITRCNEP